MSISYTISVYNELSELARLLEIVKSNKTKEDEIIIVHTYRDESEKVSPNFKDIQKLSSAFANIYKTFHFENHFALMKNYLNSLATKEYIINFDADEFASSDTINLWIKIISENNNDLFLVPRVNTVIGYTLEDIEKYKWIINNNGWINWPDYQPRIFKNNGKIKWTGDVHEQLIGYEQMAALPQDPRLAIIHHKEIIKQRKQNQLYENIIRSQSIE